MSASPSTCLLFVQMTIDEQQEEAFNDWYDHEYIPAFVRDIPGVARGRRFVTLTPGQGGAHTYLTLYEFASEEALHRGLEVMRSRDEWRALWKAWEARAVVSVHDNLFRTIVDVPGTGA